MKLHIKMRGRNVIDPALRWQGSVNVAGIPQEDIGEVIQRAIETELPLHIALEGMDIYVYAEAKPIPTGDFVGGEWPNG